MSAIGGENVDANLEGFTPATESDTIFKAGLDWQVAPDVLLYASYGEGFRAGGFNRSGNTGPNHVCSCSRSGGSRQSTTL